MTEDWMDRLEYLFGEVEADKKLVVEFESLFKKREGFERHLTGRNVMILRKRVEKMESEIDKITGIKKLPEGQITDEMIKRAKQFPLSSIIEINKREYAKCINHDDHNPSMYCKENYVYCFSCGYSGDALDVMMRVKGLSFVEAVKEMQ